jgi:ribonuclease HI
MPGRQFATCLLGGAELFRYRNSFGTETVPVPGQFRCRNSFGTETVSVPKLCALLAALVWVLRNEERPCHVITDCEYVHRGFTEWRHSWRARAWYRHPLDAELRNHSDLWREIDVLLARRAPNSVSTEWVKGHPIRRHVGELRTTDLHAWGNSAADGLATVGMRQMSGAQRRMGWRKSSAELRTISATGG